MDKENNRPAQPFVLDNASESHPASAGFAETRPLGTARPLLSSPASPSTPAQPGVLPTPADASVGGGPVGGAPQSGGAGGGPQPGGPGGAPQSGGAGALHTGPGGAPQPGGPVGDAPQSGAPGGALHTGPGGTPQPETVGAGQNPTVHLTGAPGIHSAGAATTHPAGAAGAPQVSFASPTPPAGPHPQAAVGPRSAYGPPAAAGAPGGFPARPPAQTFPGSTAAPQQPRRSGPGWLAVTAIAVACSLAGALGTAAVAGVFDDEAKGTTPQTATTTAPIGLTAGAPDWQRVAEAVGPSVVAIELRVGDGGSSGSGVITDTEGHIITNHHVIVGADKGTLDVILADGRILPAELVGSDPSTDLAVIKIKNPPADLTAAQLGTVDTLQVGQPVAAIGNPLGLAATMTTGIISALNRPVTTEQEVPAEGVVYAADRYSFTNAIQVDASINPGNSGGPLFDASGKVIGINSSIATISVAGEGGSIGLGFAIPIDVVVLITEQIKMTGVAEHAFLGVDVTDASVTVDGAGYLGVEVHKVTAGSAAESAGLRKGDIILALDDTPTLGMTSLIAEVRGLGIGQEIEVKYVRDGKIQTTTATLTSRPR